MREPLKRENLFPPIYTLLRKPDRECVLLTLRNEARNDDWELVEDYLRTHPDIGNADLRAILNISAANKPLASRLLSGWVESGLLVIANPAAGTRLRRYRLATPESSGDIVARLLADPSCKQSEPSGNPL